MSSHHIVREKQEPALLVLGLNNFDDEQLGQLLEWSPTLIATTDTAEQLHSLGIKIDWMIGDEQSGNLQSDLKHLAIGNDTVLVAALQHLITQGYPAVNVVADTFELTTYLSFADKINLVVFHQQEKIYAVAPGFSKWKPAGQEIRLLSQPKNLITTGLEQTDGLNYITIADGFFSLSFDTALLFIAEQL